LLLLQQKTIPASGIKISGGSLSNDKISKEVLILSKDFKIKGHPIY
jgi:hypothetical protein